LLESYYSNLAHDCLSRQIEHNLHAIAKTPKRFRSELLEHVHQPELIRVVYSVETEQQHRSPLFVALKNSFATYDMMQDPYVVELRKKHRQGQDQTQQLYNVLVKRDTYCWQQLKSLVTKSGAMLEELGLSATDWYLHQCMAQFEKAAQGSNQVFDLSSDEKLHLLTILRKLPFSEHMLMAQISLDHMSQKVTKLIELLITEASDNPNFTGLVFVEQRAWVATIAEILSVHPQTKDLLRVGTFIGTSKSSKRKGDVAGLAEPKNQQDTLDTFRAGKMNLILATSVLEEGIDVSKCHLVICFERPKNLKSFVQRRGRARMQKSKYIIFFPEVGGGRPMESWQALEEEMKRAYLDDQRQYRLAQEMELEEEEGERVFEVKATG
jgi:ERCC4-related helicase